MTRMLLIGCGRWGRNILRDLLSLGCEVAVADPDPEARRQAKTAGANRVAGAIVELSECDGIVIASPASTHAMVIDAALERGLPVFVEKPMVCNLADARRISARTDARLFVMDKWRYHAGIEALRRIRESGELGQPLGMHLQHVGWGTPQRDVDVSWILLPHCVSIVLEVLGLLPPAKQAFAYQEGGQAQIMHCRLGDVPWATIEVSIRSPIKRREFQMHCQGGVAWLDDASPDHIKISRAEKGSGGDAEEVERRAISTESPLLRELRAFLDYLKGGPPPRSSAQEGALIVERICELRELAALAPDAL